MNRILSLLLFAVMVVSAYYLLFDNPGIHVTIQNTGNEPLRSVVLFVTGNSYKHRLDAGGFFQPGYRGKIRLTIRDGTIQENEQHIEWWAN